MKMRIPCDCIPDWCFNSQAALGELKLRFREPPRETVSPAQVMCDTAFVLGHTGPARLNVDGLPFRRILHETSLNVVLNGPELAAANTQSGGSVLEPCTALSLSE